jgi:alpha-mannosidase
MSFESVLRALVKSGGDGGYALTRAGAEIDFAYRASRRAGADSSRVERAAAALDARARAEGAVTLEALAELEDELSPLAPLCKAYELVCAGSAHAEAAPAAIGTFRAALELLDRYPVFRVAQSQAALYRVVEEGAPELAPRIRARIAEGRWEAAAGRPDDAGAGMPAGKGLVRAMHGARRYLRDAFGAPEEAFETLFLPEHFGRDAGSPELLSSAGVKYLYRRGDMGCPAVFRWAAPEGASLLAYRDSRRIGGGVDPGIAAFLPALADATGLESALFVYGVGDREGGAGAEGVERLLDMSSWPLMPRLRFGGIGEYFRRIAPSAAFLPEARGEREDGAPAYRELSFST